MGVTDDLTYSVVPIWGYVAFSSCVFVLIWRTVHKSDCRIVRRRIKKDKKWLRQRNWLKDAGTLSVESSLAANLRHPWLSIRSKVCALTQTLPSFWWYAPTCTFVLNHSWFLTRLPSPPPLFLPFSYHLCVPGFVNISPLNLAVSFDRGPLLSELIPKEGNVKHCIYYWTTAQPGKPPRDIYISWPLSVSLVSSHTGRLWRCWGLGLTSACSCISIQIKRCKILHLA